MVGKERLHDSEHKQTVHWPDQTSYSLGQGEVPVITSTGCNYNMLLQGLIPTFVGAWGSWSVSAPLEDNHKGGRATNSPLLLRMTARRLLQYPIPLTFRDDRTNKTTQLIAFINHLFTVFPLLMPANSLSLCIYY